MTQSTSRAARLGGFDNYVKLTFDGFSSAPSSTASSSLRLGGREARARHDHGVGADVRVRFRSFWTGVLLIPWVAPTVVSALNFLWIFDYSLGVLNYMLVKVFHILPQAWLAERAHHGHGLGHRRQYLARLSLPSGSASSPAPAIPAEMYEAAAVDGRARSRFRHVTLRNPQHRDHRDAALDHLDTSTTSRSSTS